MKRRKEITRAEVHLYLQTKRKITEEYLFHPKLHPHVRERILNDCFKQFTGYRIHKRFGLTKGFDTADNFPNYNSFKHINTLDTLVWDMNHTIKKRETALYKAKLKIRQVQQKQKARRDFIKKVKAQKQAHLNMWKRGSPKKQTQEQYRLEELKKLKQSKSWNLNRNR